MYIQAWKHLFTKYNFHIYHVNWSFVLLTEANLPEIDLSRGLSNLSHDLSSKIFSK